MNRYLLRRVLFSSKRMSFRESCSNSNCTQSKRNKPEKKMQELLSKLDYNDRVVLLNELKESFDKEEKVKVAKEKVVKSMPITEIYRVCFFHACPYFVFGVLDNTIMLVFGDIIEEQIARTCGFSTMASAGLGNTVADVTSVSIAYFVEKLLCKLVERPRPIMDLDEAQIRQLNRYIQSARMLGITMGCLMGFCPLLFFSHSILGVDF